METFDPKLDVLPAAQRAIWNDLRPVAGLCFTLYGGTALALYFGHRESVDFDFFSHMPMDRKSLFDALPRLNGSQVIQEERDALTVLVPVGDAEVKLSFFGRIRFGRVGDPQTTRDGVLQVASVDDVFATKLKVLLQRAEERDYRDIDVILRHGHALERGLAAAKALYGPAFQPSEALKALAYYEDGNVHALEHGIRERLTRAAAACGALPNLSIRSERLTFCDEPRLPRETL
ncbi:MAG: nucleotidyl transferase AbiEii/AbiGii toxin family protein [Vulcanimicrobiaceae bacterium]